MVQVVPVIDVATAARPVGRSGPGRRRRRPRVSRRRLLHASATASPRAQLDALLDAARRFFALADDEKARSRWPQGRPRVAGLVPARRRAHVRRARPEGGDLLRRGAPARRPRVVAGCRCTGRTCSPRGRPSCATTVLECMDAMTASATAARRASRWALGLDARLVRPPPDRRPGRRCSASSTTRRCRPSADRPVGRRRAHRLRPAHDPRPGRRPAGSRCAARDGWVDGAAGRGRVRVQPRRHARADDRRPLPVDAAPGPQRRAAPTGCRSRSSSTPAGTPRSARCRSTARPAADDATRPLGRRERPRVVGHLRRLPHSARSARSSPSSEGNSWRNPPGIASEVQWRTARWGIRALSGTTPRRPAWKSSTAWASSALVFITNGP